MSVDMEKASDYSPSASEHGRTSANSERGSPAITEAHQADAESRWKLDLRTIPALTIVYLLYVLDRSAIGYAVDNKRDLFGTSNGTTKVYQGIYYLGFCLFVLPTVLLLPRLGAKAFIPLLMVGWGAMTMIQAGVSSWAGLAAVQFFLGVFQSGFWASIVLYLSSQYKRNELALRLALVYGLGTVLGSFNGPISYSVFKIASSSLAGWRILMLIWGAITVALAPLAFLLLPQSVQSNERFDMSAAIKAASDKHTIAYAFIAVFLGASTSACALIIPQMMSTLDTGTLPEDLNTVATYATGFFILMFLAASSDFYGERSTHLGATLVASLVGLVNLTLVYYIHKRDSAWFICFILAVTVFISPLFHAWYSHNMPSTSARVGVVGVVVGAFHVGDLCGWLAFFNTTTTTSSSSSSSSSSGSAHGAAHKRSSGSADVDDLQGLKITCGYMVVAILAIFAYGAWLKKENRAKGRQHEPRQVSNDDAAAGTGAHGRDEPGWRWVE